MNRVTRILTLCTLLVGGVMISHAQDSLLVKGELTHADKADTLMVMESGYVNFMDSLLVEATKPRPWMALAEATSVNLIVHSFDRFVMNKDYAKTSVKSGIDNIKNGFVWDNDRFSCNLFSHPYHGNLYFNSARENGLNFWQSIGYPFIGSLQWEFFGETEPPAINDLIATTFGGICIGEVLHRVSNTVLDDSRSGSDRFWREALAFVLNPVKGVNRIATGKAWRVRHNHNLYHNPHRNPIDFSITTGWRHISDNEDLMTGDDMTFVNMYMEYGDVMNRGEYNQPYDYFNVEATFAIHDNQPLINHINILGRLWSTPLLYGRKCEMEFGIYQHFDYYDSEAVKGGSEVTPYRISEAASFGIGSVLQFPTKGMVQHFEQRFYANTILLGGTKSDYFNVLKRDYNMGNGFSLKTKTHLELRNFGRFILNSRFYKLYTWKGYEGKDLETCNPLFVNSQGDKGSVRLFVLNPIIEINISPKYSFSAQGMCFYRHSCYKYFPHIRTHAYDLRMGFTCHL